MLFFKPKTKLLLALDINTSSVRAAVFWSHANAKPDVFRTFKESAKFSTKGSFAEMRRGIYAALDRLLKKIDQSVSPHKIDGILVSLSSPWYFAQPRLVEFQQDEPVVLTHDLITEKLEAEKKSVVSELAQKYKIDGGNLEILEAAITNAYLNGYGVRGVYGKKAGHVSLYVYVSAVFQEMTADIRRKAEEALGVREVHFHTTPFILFNRLIHEVPNGEFIMVEVGEEVTDVILVRQGSVQELSSFARGSNFLSRHLASYFKVSVDEALSYINMLNSGHLQAETEAQVKQVLAEGTHEWKNFLEQILGEFYKTSSVPEQIFVFGPSSLVKYFTGIVSSQDFARFSSSASVLQTEQLNPAAAKGEMSRGYGLRTHEEALISFLVLFYNEHIRQKEAY